jgi:hypothetical protein
LIIPSNGLAKEADTATQMIVEQLITLLPGNKEHHNSCASLNQSTVSPEGISNEGLTSTVTGQREITETCNTTLTNVVVDGCEIFLAVDVGR